MLWCFLGVGVWIGTGCVPMQPDTPDNGGQGEVPPQDPPVEEVPVQCRALLNNVDSFSGVLLVSDLQCGYVFGAIPYCGFSVGLEYVYWPESQVRALVEATGQVELCGIIVRNNDPDNDGVPTAEDNCPSMANPNSQDDDIDRDGEGDACDLDDDGDGSDDVVDNCPETYNRDQGDEDEDGVGDECDPDYGADACPTDPNKDEPGICGCGHPDTDSDGDGDPNCVDNCPSMANADQADGDGDGKGNVCDNCATVSNADQADADGDGVGNACEPTPPTPPSNPNCEQLVISANGYHVELYNLQIPGVGRLGDHPEALWATRWVGYVGDALSFDLRCRVVGDLGLPSGSGCTADNSSQNLAASDTWIEGSDDWDGADITVYLVNGTSYSLSCEW